MPRKISDGYQPWVTPVVEHVQHAALFVDADVHARRQGNVAHQHAEADGHQQQRFVVLGDAQVDEQAADGQHGHVAPGEVADDADLQKIPEDVHDGPSICS